MTKKVTVLLGGFSREREISIQTGHAIIKALKKLGHEVSYLDVQADFLDQIVSLKPQICYNALHGTFGEDGQIQGILDLLGIAYTGENRATSALAFDKLLTKWTYDAAGVPTPKWQYLGPNSMDVTELTDFDYPVFVKPTSEGSSVGVEKLDSQASLIRGRDRWHSRPHLIEQGIKGAELSVAIFGRDVLGSVQIVPERDFYDYEAKYGNANTQYHLPPSISEAQIRSAEDVALKAHLSLGCQGLCRTDVMVSDKGAYALETNTLPGMTQSSLVPKIAQYRGTSFVELVDCVLQTARYDDVMEGLDV